MVCRVILLRHGETALNRGGALRGRVDVPLSVNGWRDVRQLAARIEREYRLSAISSSTLLRARSTAEEVARVAGLSVETDDRFNVVDYGVWAARTADSFSPADEVAFRRWQGHPEVPLPGAEDPAVAQRRALTGFAARTAFGEGCVARVAHDAILQLLLCGFLGVDLRSYHGIVQRTATRNEVERVTDGWRIRLLNSAYHLDGN